MLGPQVAVHRDLSFRFPGVHIVVAFTAAEGVIQVLKSRSYQLSLRPKAIRSCILQGQPFSGQLEKVFSCGGLTAVVVENSVLPFGTLRQAHAPSRIL